MSMTYQSAAHDLSLRQFLGADLPSAKCRLLLPHFKGDTLLDSNGASQAPLSYRGFTFAEADSKAAFYVHSLAGPVFESENIAIEPVVSGQKVGPTAFLFGSRSNVMTQELLQVSGQDLVQFEFGPDWKIKCNGMEFSMPDPSQIIDLVQYENTTDYAVIAKLRSTEGSPVFLIAGLGGRATEGAAQFFAKNWHDLAILAGEENFAAVLQFDAPFQLDNCRIVASAKPSVSQRKA